MSTTPVKCIETSIVNKVGIISMCRPKKLNSFIYAMYDQIRTALEEWSKDDRVVVVLITGQGRFFSSGADLNAQTKEMMKLANYDGDKEKYLLNLTQKRAGDMLRAFIEFPKPVIAAVNGPVFGIGATMILFADIIYASSTATFTTPFMQLGFCAEGGSSLLFPQIMGLSKANEMLLLGRTLSAIEAERTGLAAAIFPPEKLMEQVMKRASKMASFPPQALQDTKALVRTAKKKKEFHDVVNAELTMLAHRFMSEECKAAMMSFFMKSQARSAQRKAKL